MGGAGLLNGEHVEHIAQAGAHDADEQEVGQALEIDPLEQGDVLEHIQPHRPVEGRHRAGVAQEKEHQQLHTAEEEAAAGDHDGAHLGGLPLAQHGVQGEEQGGQDGQHHAEEAAAPAPQDGDGQNPQHLQHQGQDVVPPDALPEEQEGQNRDKDGVAGEDHRHHIGVAADQGQLVEHHGQGHAEEPGDGEGPQVFGGEFPLLPVQGPGGHRQQEEAADQETAQGDLHGMKSPLHRREL